MKIVIGDIEINVPGRYNPDILEDMTNRAAKLYKEASAADVLAWQFEECEDGTVAETDE